MRKQPFNLSSHLEEKPIEVNPDGEAKVMGPEPAPETKPAEVTKSPEPVKVETKTNWLVVILAVVITAVAVYFFMKSKIAPGA